MGWFSRWTDQVRKYFLRVGYTCDVCGAELFNYPARRLCAACEETLVKPVRPCERCGREKRADGLCNDCKSLPPSYTRGTSVFVYRGNVAMVVNRLKNGNAKLAAYLGEKMGEALLTACPNVGAENPFLLPVPMTKESRAERGYNQTERLCEGICEKLLERGFAAEMDFTVLEKRRETKPQKRMTRKERMENVKGAYGVRKRTACKGRTIVLVDDVTTSGATGSEIAKKLFRAGARAVYLLTVAAVPESK